MARVLPVANRVTQKAVLALALGFFNGHVSAVMLPVDTAKLTFNANVTINAGVAGKEAVYTPCDDNGKVKTFSNIDDLLTWLRNAYNDILTVSLTIDSFPLISKVFVPPTDVLKDALAKKTSFTKLSDGLTDNLTAANLEVTRAVTAGWNAVDAHPAFKANYDELVAKRDAIVAAKAYYTARIAFYQSIITPIP